MSNAPVFNVFIMQPPSDEKKKEKSLGDIMRELMKASGHMEKMAAEMKNLPHTEHAGGGV